MNSSERISPCPVSSTLKTSIVEDRSFLRILQTPSPIIVAFKTVPISYIVIAWADLQSSNADAKLIHIFPSHVPFPRLFTVPGIDAVSISSTLFKMPSGVRNPTMILGTPRRNDCIQNFISLRSNVIISLSFRISALVFSSTQLMGLPSVGFESHTCTCKCHATCREGKLTSINFTT